MNVYYFLVTCFAANGSIIFTDQSPNKYVLALTVDGNVRVDRDEGIDYTTVFVGSKQFACSQQKIIPK